MKIALLGICFAGLGTGFVAGLSEAEVTATVLTAFIAIATPIAGLGVFLKKEIKPEDVVGILNKAGLTAGVFIAAVAGGIVGGILVKNNNLLGMSLVDIKSEYESVGLWNDDTKNLAVGIYQKHANKSLGGTFKRGSTSAVKADEAIAIICEAVRVQGINEKPIKVDDMVGLLNTSGSSLFRDYLSPRLSASDTDDLIEALGCSSS